MEVSVEMSLLAEGREHGAGVSRFLLHHPRAEAIA